MTENQVKIYTDPGNGIGTPSHNNYNKVNFTFLYLCKKLTCLKKNLFSKSKLNKFIFCKYL